MKKFYNNLKENVVITIFKISRFFQDKFWDSKLPNLFPKTREMKAAKEKSDEQLRGCLRELKEMGLLKVNFHLSYCD